MSSGDLQPLVCTFQQLSRVTFQLHRDDQVLLARLHDIWVMGAPSPDSRVMVKRYDPRLMTRGVYERRIVFPNQLIAWIQDVACARGMRLDPKLFYQTLYTKLTTTTVF